MARRAPATGAWRLAPSPAAKPAKARTRPMRENRFPKTSPTHRPRPPRSPSRPRGGVGPELDQGGEVGPGPGKGPGKAGHPAGKGEEGGEKEEGEEGGGGAREGLAEPALPGGARGKVPEEAAHPRLHRL
ncbi:hypothetical protein TthTF25_11740 [Thermus thermophilus]